VMFAIAAGHPQTCRPTFSIARLRGIGRQYVDKL